jgi:predicted nuclease with TOPRIM domain
MKAWEEIDQDPYISLYETSKSQYYIDHGCKIERFNDGRFELKNLMTNSDHYEDMPEDIYKRFEDDGWLVGAFSMCAHVYRTRSQKVAYLVERSRLNENEELVDRLLGTYDRLKKKYEDYEMRIEKLYSSLQP